MKYISIVALIFLGLFSTGCANSANHRVVPLSMAGDSSFDCDGIEQEKLRLNAIIDGVEQDKNDMTGADFVDGLLYFPFNVIAKQSNYSNAVKAAEERKSYLSQIAAQKNCTKTNRENLISSANSSPANQSNDIVYKLETLKKLSDDKLITEEEYKEKKKEILLQY